MPIARRWPLVLLALVVYVAVALIAAPPAHGAELRTVSQTGITYEVKTFGRWRTERVGELAARTEDAISGDLLLAEASRETSLRNITGGGYFDPAGHFVVTGVDRGLWQINATFHAAFLQTHRGALSGSYSLTFSSAYPAGRVPGLTDAGEYVIALLRGNIAYATRYGVPAGDAVRVAVAGYNSGIGPATSAYLIYGNPDRYTTGGDYSRDVLNRRTLVRRARRALGYR